MVIEDKRDMIAEINEEAIVLDNPSFDGSIIGMTTDGCVVYSLEKMIIELANDDGMSEQDAMEFIDFNTIRALPYAGEYAPVIVDMGMLWEEFEK